jgi:hypothetical protein
MTALPESDAATSLRLERLVLEDAADRVGHGGAVDDGAVDDAVGRHGSVANATTLKLFPRPSARRL